MPAIGRVWAPVVIVFCTFCAAARSAGTTGDGQPAPKPAVTAEQAQLLRQILHEALREVEAAEKDAGQAGERRLGFLGSDDVRRTQVTTLTEIGRALALLDDRDPAVETWEQAVDVASADDDLVEKARQLLAIAQVQAATGAKEIALATLELALQAGRTIKQDARSVRLELSASGLKARVLEEIASAFRKLGEPNAADRAHRLAVQAADSIDVQLEKVISLSAMARSAEPSENLAWEHAMQAALAQQDPYEQMSAARIVLLDACDAGVYPTALQLVEKQLTGDLKGFGLLIVFEQLAQRGDADQSISAEMRERCARLARDVNIQDDFKQSKILAALALARARAGDLEGARQMLASLPEHDPAQALTLRQQRGRILSTIALVLLKQGDRMAAAKACEEALAVGPEFELAMDARENLAELKGSLGEREAAMRIAESAPEISSRISALERVAVAAAEHADPAGVQVVIDHMRVAAQAIPLATLWHQEKGAQVIEGTRGRRYIDVTRYSFPLSMRNDAIVAIARTQARTGDIVGAYATLESLSVNRVDRFETGNSDAEKFYREIVAILTKRRDFAAAQEAAGRLAFTAYDAERNLAAVESVAREQAAAGDAQGALAWAVKQSTPVGKFAALKGVAGGIARLANPEKPAVR